MYQEVYEVRAEYDPPGMERLFPEPDGDVRFWHVCTGTTTALCGKVVDDGAETRPFVDWELGRLPGDGPNEIPRRCKGCAAQVR